MRVDLRCDEDEVTTAAGCDKLLLLVKHVPLKKKKKRKREREPLVPP